MLRSSGLLFLFTFVTWSQCVEFLTFYEVEKASKDTVGYITNDKTELIFDATATGPRVVYFAEKKHLADTKFTFYCYVNQTSPLRVVSMCCRSSTTDSQAACNPVDLNKRDGDVTCMQTRFKYVADPLLGVMFSVTSKKNVKAAYPIGGLFYCSVTDSSGTSIHSNEIDIRDAGYYMDNLDLSRDLAITQVPPIDPGSFPFAFQCKDVNPSMKTWPEWLNLLSASHWPYEWAYCEVKDSPNAQTCAYQSIALSDSDHLKFLNGTMYLLNKRLIEGNQIAILCRPKGVLDPLKTFAGDFSSDHTPGITAPLSVLPNSSTSTTKLQALTATEQSFSMQTGSNTGGFKLKALYRQPTAGVKAVWTKDDQPLPKQLSTIYSYQLPEIVSTAVDGKYVLTVNSREDPSDVLRFVYNIKVVEPPVFTSPSCLSGLIYVVEGTDYNISCPVTFRSAPKPVVGINLYEADSPEKLRELLESNIVEDPKLKALQFYFELKKEKQNSGEMAILLYDMKEGQNFQLSSKLESLDGGSSLSSSVRVIPTPKLLKPPSGYSCSEGCDTEPYNVSCMVDPDRIKMWKENFNVTYSTAWIIQNQWSSLRLDPQGIGHFFETTQDGVTLTVWPRGNPAMRQPNSKTSPPAQGDGQVGEHGNESGPDSTISESTTLKQYIVEVMGESRAKDLLLQCWIRLYVHSPEARFDPPPSDRVLRRVSRQHQGVGNSLDNTPRLLYDSRWEPNKILMDQLTITRTFTPDPKPATASLAWIAAVVIGVIIVISVIVLTVWLYTRDRGKVYMLDEKEYAHGNDPKLEMKEKENFQTYERQEDQPIASSQYSLNDGDVSVGSDDDGELDDYGKDYDEKGSFIHAYETDPTRLASYQPPSEAMLRGSSHRLPPDNTAV
ncbi:hypothetical protein D915_000770 [Fasciola hepatica]|uniref:Neurofascin/L1/NrCAM C-terminal domain-containing protein n=1 Tax=Fasciola hepatica TaxID=6192 RepID=A0A4E0S339_FASHE|nr:hypothetical protein D915_000770 [Fasciola hepatica]